MYSAIGYIAGRIRMCSEKESMAAEEKENLAYECHAAWQKQILFFRRISEKASEER
jgi:hypothetical protein